LRSGEYEQTTERLKSKTECKYCCLGVAAVVAGYNNNSQLENNGELGEIVTYHDEYHEDFTYDLFDKFNVPMQLIEGELPNDCIDMNDNIGMSFPEIADWITENVEFI